MVLKFKDFLEERDNEYIESHLLCEMAISPSKMSDKYGEVIGSVVDNLICICLYPDNPTVPHWKERAHGLCKRFIDLNISPANKNTSEFRLKCLSKGVLEELDDDYGAILNHFKSVSVYYSKKSNPHDRLTPYKPYKEAYEENKEKVKEGIVSLTKFVAEQDYDGMVEYMDNFN